MLRECIRRARTDDKEETILSVEVMMLRCYCITHVRPWLVATLGRGFSLERFRAISAWYSPAITTLAPFPPSRRMSRCRARVMPRKVELECTKT